MVWNEEEGDYDAEVWIRESVVEGGRKIGLREIEIGVKLLRYP